MSALFADPKALFATIAALLYVAAYVPYIRDMRAGKAKPHTYTWLIWTLTTATATAGSWYGGGGWSAVFQTLSFFLTSLFFLLSLRYGTRDITMSDSIVLMLACAAILVWWQLHSPVLAILMVTAIDGIAYVPTIRKLIAEPGSEPAFTWVLFFLYPLFALLAVHTYNLLTVPYLLMCLIANAVILSLCFRKRAISVP
jgi:hypothetical protein